MTEPVVVSGESEVLPSPGEPAPRKEQPAVTPASSPSRSTLSRRALLLLGSLLLTATTATITWIVKEALERARLHADLLSIELSEPGASFTRGHLTALSDFFEEKEEFEKVMLEAARELESTGVDFGTQTDSIDPSVAFVQALTRAQAIMSEKVTLPIGKVEKAIEKADDVTDLLEQTRNQIRQFLSANPGPIEAKREEYIELFVGFDDNQKITAYLPVRPDEDEPADVWHGVLRVSVGKLSSLSELYRSAMEELEKEVEAAHRLGPQKGDLKVQVLVVNRGHQSAGLLDIAALNILGAGTERLVLSSDTPLEELAISGRSHRVLTFSMDKSDRNSIQAWTNSMNRFRSSNSDCVLRMRTTDGRTVESGNFPFYPRDEFKERVLQDL